MFEVPKGTRSLFKKLERRNNMAKLTVIIGKNVGKEFELGEGENLLGRLDAESQTFPEVNLDDEDLDAKVSRRHAVVIVKEGNLYLEDIGSLNGTFVKGRAEEPLGEGEVVKLSQGDEIVIGSIVLKVN